MTDTRTEGRLNQLEAQASVAMNLAKHVEQIERRWFEFLSGYEARMGALEQKVAEMRHMGPTLTNIGAEPGEVREVEQDPSSLKYQYDIADEFRMAQKVFRICARRAEYAMRAYYKGGPDHSDEEMIRRVRAAILGEKT